MCWPSAYVKSAARPFARGDIARQQCIADDAAAYVMPLDMLVELRDDNQRCIAAMRATSRSTTRPRFRGRSAGNVQNARARFGDGRGAFVSARKNPFPAATITVGLSATG
jgi:hypothetical protein